MDITYLVANNQRFSLTTGQASPTTKQTVVTKTTPWGEIKTPLNPLALSLESGASLVARGFAGDAVQLTEIIKEAIEHKGFSHVDILQPCVSFNPEQSYEWYRSVIYKLEEHKYSPEGKKRALEKVWEFEASGRMPTGIFYKEEKESYEEALWRPKGETKN